MSKLPTRRLFRLRRAAASLALAAACLSGAACTSGANPPPARPAPPAKPQASGRAAPPSTAAPGRPAPPGSATAPRRRNPVDEVYQVPAAELADYLLQSMIGVAAISVGIGPDDQETAPVIYLNDGETFTASGKIELRGTRPISTFRIGTDPIVNRSRAIVRRYPVVERKGMFVRVALDPCGRRTEWMRRTMEGSFPDNLSFFDFNDGGSFHCYQLDLAWLGGGAPRKLFQKPDKAAPATTLATAPGAAGRLDGDVVPLQRKGNFIEIAAVRGLDDPRTGIGWIEMKDAKGRLSVWFKPGPDC
jgi:hypothetical protein